MKKLILPLCLALFSMLSCEGDGTFLESDESAVSRLSSDSGSVPTSGGEPDNSGLIYLCGEFGLVEAQLTGDFYHLLTDTVQPSQLLPDQMCFLIVLLASGLPLDHILNV